MHILIASLFLFLSMGTYRIAAGDFVHTTVSRTLPLCTYAYMPKCAQPVSPSQQIIPCDPPSFRQSSHTNDAHHAYTYTMEGCIGWQGTYTPRLPIKSTMLAAALDYGEQEVAIFVRNQRSSTLYDIGHLLLYKLAEKEPYKTIYCMLPIIDAPYKLFFNPMATALALSTKDKLFVWALTKTFQNTFATKVAPLPPRLDQPQLVRIYEKTSHHMEHVPLFTNEEDIFSADKHGNIQQLSLTHGCSVQTYAYGKKLFDMDRTQELLIASGTQGAKIWHIPSGQLLQHYYGYMIGRDISFSNDAQHILIRSSDMNDYEIWQRVEPTDTYYPIISLASLAHVTPELYTAHRSTLLAYATDPNATPKIKQAVYTTLAILCTRIAHTTDSAIQRSIYTNWAEKYEKLLSDT